MLWVLAIMTVSAIAEVLICGISLMTLFTLIPCVLLGLRIVGTVVKPTTLAVLEFVGLGTWLVWRAFIRGNFELLAFLVFILCVFVRIIIYFVDDDKYVYVVEDDEES